MAYLIQPDYVKYVCSCGQMKPITSLYFCRHCLKIRCGFCICHEVDSHYCTNCLENMPSSEARLKKNRCSSCFDCPSCFHTLSTRATLVQPRAAPEAGDQKLENKQPKKMYYLSCFNCRWTSRDVGIPDQPVASGGWPERTNPFSARFNQLLEYYKAIAQQEKQEKLERERKKIAIRGKYITLTDKTGVTGAMARTIAGMGTGEGAAAGGGLTLSQPTADVEELPEDYYTKEVKLNQITSMCQRLAAPEWQASAVARLAPIARLLSVKRSQRCRACDHNLTKPEYNPGSIKFKIELLAYYHVPEVKIISYEPIKPGQKSALLLKLTNPTSHEMSLRLIQPDEVPVKEKEEEEEPSIDRSLEKSLQIDKDMSLYKSVQRAVSLPRGVALSSRGVAVSLSQRDDAAEYDDEQHDTSDIIVWRKSNKVALRLELSTLDTVPVGSPAAAAISLEYSYRNTVPPTATAVAQPDHTLYTTVILDLGTVSE